MYNNPMVALQIHLFGVPRFEREGKEVNLNRRKMQALLAYLAITGQPHSRETLAVLFWPENDTSSALANLRRELSRLKEVIREETLSIGREHVRIHPEAQVWLDVDEFQRLIQIAKSHNHPLENSGLCAVCAKSLEEAARLYTADFMAGFNLPDCPDFDEWQFFELEKLRQLQAELLGQLTQWYIDRRQPHRGIDYARRWLALDQLHELGHRKLMELYALAGRPAAALRQFQALTNILDQEIGAEPEKETRELFEAIHARRFPPPPLPAHVQPATGEQPAAVDLQGVLDLPAVDIRPAVETPGIAAGHVDRYIQEELLQTGGFGEIYLGRDQISGQPVAIKRLKPDLVAERPDLVSRFLQEGEALRQLKHPNIVRMLDAYESDGQYLLVMEYLPGGALRDLINRQSRLPVARVLDICLELADALARAHHLHILHRDLKPENVLLSADDRPRLIDFGLARLERFDSRLTQAGLIFGSPAYMSPEALRGLELDARADIWSFGVMMYEMLAGQPPFQGEEVMVVLTHVLNEPLPDLIPMRPDVPDELHALIKHMLIKDRDARLSSMRKVAAVLESIREAEIQKQSAVSGAVAGGSSAHEDRQELTGQYRETIAPASDPQPKLQKIYTQSTPLIGREKELKKIQQILESKECRLLTLVGTGGVGKTRLAVEIARQMSGSFPDGTTVVLLAPVNRSDDILPAILEALQVGIRVGIDPAGQLINYLRDRSLLLVLDSFEHLMDSAGLLADILANTGKVKLLVTARERLNLNSEWLYEVEGLSYPADSMISGVDSQILLETYPAVQLFVQRAYKMAPDFVLKQEDLTAVIKICRLVDGMPLALELAATWAPSMSLTEIAQEIEQNLDLLATSMRDVSDRHRSIRAVFEQSWQRLSQSEQILLENLSVFAGGCSHLAVLKVTGAQPEMLAVMVDRAFLRRRGERFEMHELVRQFAHERLSPERHEDMVARHSRYYLSLLAERTADLKDGRQKEAVAEIVIEIDNIRASWQRAVRRLDLQGLAEVAEAYWLYNDFRGTLHEGEEAFRLAAEHLLYIPYQASLAGFMLAAQGCMTARHGQLEHGRLLMARGIELQTRSARPDRQMLAFSRAWMGFVLLLQGRYGEARQLMEENLTLYPGIKDRWSQAGSLRVLGGSLLFSGRLDEAGKYLQKCLRICEEINERRVRRYALMNLGILSVWLGEYERARQWFEEGLEVSAESNDPLSRADTIRERTRLYLATGDYATAMEEIQSCLSIYREIGRSDISAAIVFLGWVYYYQGQPGQAERAFREGLAAARMVGNRPDEASSLEGLARIALWQRDRFQAHAYFDEALQIWQEIGHEPQVALLLVQVGSTVLESGRAGAYEQALGSLLTALQPAVKYRLAPVAMQVFVGLTRLLLYKGGKKNIERSRELLGLVCDHASIPYYARTDIERIEEQIGKADVERKPKEDWPVVAERWIEWINKEQPAGV